MRAHVHNSTMHDGQKVLTTGMSTSGGTDKQPVAHPGSGILASQRKEGSMDTCFHMEEPQKHYAK